MQREGHAGSAQAAKARRGFGAVWTKTAVRMNVGAEVDEIGVHAGLPPEGPKAPRLGWGAYAVVLNGEAMIEARTGFLERGERVEGHPHRFIAVGMGVNLNTPLPERHHAVDEVGPGNLPRQALLPVEIAGEG